MLQKLVKLDTKLTYWSIKPQPLRLSFIIERIHLYLYWTKVSCNDFTCIWNLINETNKTKQKRLIDPENKLMGEGAGEGTR